MVRVDYVGAIVMTGNITATSGTKNMDIRYNYVNEYIEYCIVKIVFATSAENDSNILSKYLGVELHAKDSKKIIGEKPD